ncbi:cardiolipin synthase [Sporothrix schenckii 1099-18]|uniref:CDP-diacylglycerol-glycerol-3-phosphate 3-phosphatidyltransferase n=2 Tax=Sporothrix schenckii TaxID=29908 RepID=U7PRR1_SPOS1|nr:cardiolipin synthase [Sporothrix schenckii 1099-18]ERS97160.1 hypothetical protein HMPREF1624_06491 [Sporothrix schenckii ATCC 58251]KJR86377.1 cardiolipin synthase [Sporothrix schenckii 1099-18]
MLRLTIAGCGRGGQRTVTFFAASAATSTPLSPFALASVWPQTQTQPSGAQTRPISTTSKVSAVSIPCAPSLGSPSRAQSPLRGVLLSRLRSGALGRQQQHVRLLSDKGSLSPPTPASSSSSSHTLPPTTTTRHENIYTVPNFLTVARLIAAPFVGYLIVADQPGWALSLLAAAAVTDILDGWIARRWNLHTVVGSVIDPMADKVLMTVLAVSLAAQGGLPVWLAVLVLGRDAGLGVAAIYYRWVSLPPPKTFSRYWDFSLPSAEVRPTTISKYNTFLQLALMGVTTAAPVLAASTGTVAAMLGGPYDLTAALTVMQYIVAVTTVWSGASYVYSKDAVKILTQKTKSP